MRKTKRSITDYALFAVEGELFYSPGLIERMQPLDHKRATKSEQCRRTAGAKWLIMNKTGNAGAMQEEESRGRRKNEEDGGGSFYSTTRKVGIKSSTEKAGIKSPPEYAYNKAMHNLEGLQRSLDALGVREPKEIQAIMSLSDYGRLEGTIWKLLYHTKWSKIQQPARFLIAGLRKGN